MGVAEALAVGGPCQHDACLVRAVGEGRRLCPGAGLWGWGEGRAVPMWHRDTDIQ